MKRIVESYSVQVIGTDVHVDIKTDRQKAHKYRIWADTRHPDIFEIARHLNEGLGEAKKLGSKIDISDYLERMYVFIILPVKYQCDQYSAQAR